MNRLFTTGLVLCLSIGTGAETFAQPRHAPAYGKREKERYYYYPSANVYYNPVRRNYAYFRGGAWLTVNILPPTIVIASTPRYVVYHEGPDVWIENRVHVASCRPPARVVYREYDRRGRYDRHDHYDHHRDHGRKHHKKHRHDD